MDTTQNKRDQFKSRGSAASIPDYFLQSASRRTLLKGGLGLSLGLLLVACGDDDEEPTAIPPTATEEPTEPPTEAPAATSATDEEPGFPVTVTHAMGETTIPAQPTRIVSINEGQALDALQSVGVKPVLYGQSGGYIDRRAAWLDPDFIDGVEFFEWDWERDLELIAGASPDLILDTWVDDPLYEQQSGIAPTIILTNDDVTPWQDMQRLVGRAVGREQEAEAAIAETEQVLAEQSARLEEIAGLKVYMAYIWGEEFIIHGANTSGARILTAMGVELASPNPDELTFLSLERWNEIEDADIIFSLAYFPEDAARQEEDPLFRLLPAVVNGSYVSMDGEVAQALYLESAPSVRWVAPRVVDALLEAAAGNGRQVSNPGRLARRDSGVVLVG